MKKRLLRAAFISMVMVAALLLSACGGVSESDISAAVESKNVDDVISVEEQYAEQDNKGELDDSLAEQFKTLCESTDYSDYEFMDQVIAKVKDKDLAKKLSETIEDNCTNKVIAFTEGEWVRRDMTDQDGIVLKFKWNEGAGTGVITETKNAPKTDFKQSDIKWKNATVISEKEFSYEELVSDDYGADYMQGLGKINYENNTIKCQISGVYSDYSDGYTQVWVRKDVIDPEKEIITKSDLKEMHDTDTIESGEYYYHYYEKYISDKKLRKKVEEQAEPNTTFRGKVSFGDSRKKVIEYFGYGHIVYQSYKDDPIYVVMSNDDNDIVKKGLKDIIKQAKYAVIYTNKKNSMITSMYFNSKDELMGIVSVGDSYDKVCKYADEVNGE